MKPTKTEKFKNVNGEMLHNVNGEMNMERIILYPNTPEFELLEKLKPIIEDSLLKAFTAGFKAGQQLPSYYTDEQIKMFYDEFSNDLEPLEVKHIILD